MEFKTSQEIDSRQKQIGSQVSGDGLTCWQSQERMGNENCVNILLKPHLHVRLKNVCGRAFHTVSLLLCALFIL